MHKFLIMLINKIKKIIVLVIVELNTNTIKDMVDKSNNDMETAVKSIEHDGTCSEVQGMIKALFRL